MSLRADGVLLLWQSFHQMFLALFTLYKIYFLFPLPPPPTPLRPFHLSTLGRRAGAASLPIQRRPLGLGRCILKRIPRPSVCARAGAPWEVPVPRVREETELTGARGSREFQIRRAISTLRERSIGTTTSWRALGR